MAERKPGEWWFRPEELSNGGRLNIYEADGSTNRVAASIREPLPIYEANGHDLDIEAMDAEQLRRARFTVAAPDLYEAAVSALDYLESCLDPKCEPGCGCVLDVLRQAIAKAEGRDA